MDVGDKAERRNDILTEQKKVLGTQERRHEEDGEGEGRVGGRQEPLRSSPVEVAEGEGPRASLAEDVTADEEARNHEEDVNAQKTAL